MFVARAGGFAPRDYFQLDDAAERAAPRYGSGEVNRSLKDVTP